MTNGTLWYEKGFPEVLYSTIMEDIVAAFGNWENYDIIIKKITPHPFYKAFHAVNDAARFGDDTKLLSLLCETGMTDEDRSWEGWDFDDLFKITPYLKWQKELGDSFRRIDKELKTCFYDELAELVAKEEDEKTVLKGTSTATGSAKAEDPDDPDDEPEQNQEMEEEMAHGAEEPRQEASAPAQPTTRVRPSSGAVETTSSVNIDKILAGVKFKKWADMFTPEEKSWITGVDDKGNLMWAPEAGELLKDQDTKDLIPEKVHFNPYTGRVYQEVA
jgi:hypothetical protein